MEQRGQSLIITAQGRNPTLGKNGLKLLGPVTVRLSTRGPGGAGKVRWCTRQQAAFPDEGQEVTFSLPASVQPVETLVTLPAESVRHLLLRLPAQESPVT